MINLQIQSNLDPSIIETFKELFLKIDPNAIITLKDNKSIDNILENYEKDTDYNSIKLNMDNDIKSYYAGDMSGFEKLGTAWHK
ncbi:hypothetical protein [Campylobacter sp. RM16187]|uniref:hypothetical protein n=1 Tax=Campylobacter sp. RM16187 TaxID=1660063 RepID=UPI0021B59530|nr:hypothetical protein [Campylobacter sp. RM16187]QKG30313.1 hypothetical protein CDOMF_b015 [Campylobacter sp. RM16187]